MSNHNNYKHHEHHHYLYIDQFYHVNYDNVNCYNYNSARR